MVSDNKIIGYTSGIAPDGTRVIITLDILSKFSPVKEVSSSLPKYVKRIQHVCSSSLVTLIESAVDKTVHFKTAQYYHSEDISFVFGKVCSAEIQFSLSKKCAKVPSSSVKPPDDHTGLWIYYNPSSGIPEEESFYLNGTRKLFTRYFPTGMIQKEIDSTGDQGRMETIYFDDPEHKKKTFKRFTSGGELSSFTEWNIDGQKIADLFYPFGKLSTSWRREDDVITEKEFYPNRIKKCESVSYGKTLVSVSTYDEEGMKSSPWNRYDSTGKMVSNTPYKHGVPHGTWVSDGKTRTLVDGILNGAYEEKNGYMLKTGTYLMSRPVGVWREYEIPELITATIYKDCGFYTKVTYGSNKIVSKKSYTDQHVPHGDHVEFEDDGSLKTLKKYEYGRLTYSSCGEEDLPVVGDMSHLEEAINNQIHRETGKRRSALLSIKFQMLAGRKYSPADIKSEFESFKKCAS